MNAGDSGKGGSVTTRDRMVERGIVYMLVGMFAIIGMTWGMSKVTESIDRVTETITASNQLDD